MKRQALRRKVILLAATLTLFALFMGSCGGGNEESSNGSASKSGDTTGVTDTEIRIGTLLPMTGTAAAWGIALSKGMQAYFDYINDQGGLYGRKLTLFVGDSAYSGPVAAESVRRLVEQDKVFAIQGTLGTEVESAVYQYLEQQGVPDMYILSGASQWTVPVAPNRFTALIDYSTEGRTFARYIYDNYDGKKLGIIAQNDDYGKEGVAGMTEELKELNADVAVSVEYYDATQSDVTAQVQRLQNEGVGIMAFWGQPVQAANMMKTARVTLNWDVPMMINSPNALDIVAVLAGLDNIEGTVSATIGSQAWETDKPSIAERKEIMAKYAPDVTWDNTALGGYVISEGIVGFLKQAGPNLTRESFMAAMESLCKFMCDTCLVPASTSASDHRLVEAEILVKATVDRSTEPPTFRWVPFGEPYDYESTTECTVPTPPPDATSQPGNPLPGENR
jgi:branched-chain amino acid transport system substrate-binding protein